VCFGTQFSLSSAKEIQGERDGGASGWLQVSRLSSKTYGICRLNSILHCSEPVPSPQGGFGGLSPPNKAPSPQIETWNTVSGVLVNFKMSSSPKQTQSPPIENFLATVLLRTQNLLKCGRVLMDWLIKGHHRV